MYRITLHREHSFDVILFVLRFRNHFSHNLLLHTASCLQFRRAIYTSGKIILAHAKVGGKQRLWTSSPVSRARVSCQFSLFIRGWDHSQAKDRKSLDLNWNGANHFSVLSLVRTAIVRGILLLEPIRSVVVIGPNLIGHYMAGPLFLI